MDKMLKLFRLIEEENNYIRQYLDKFSSLTAKEKVLVHYTCRDCTLEEIAEMFNRQVTQLEADLEKIKTKLGLDSKEDLEKFARIFKII